MKKRKNSAYIQGLLREVAKVGPEDMLLLKEKLNLTAGELCELLGVHYTTYQRIFLTKVSRMSNVYKLFVILANANNELRPLDNIAVYRQERSYWTGWQDAGGMVPEDVLREYKEPLPDNQIDFDQYRKGVREYVERPQETKKGEDDV